MALTEINEQFNHHRGEINHLKIREKDAKDEVEKLKGFVVGAAHEAHVFQDCLNRMEENVCSLQVWLYSFRGWRGVCVL